MKPPYFILQLKPDLTLEDCIDFLNWVTENGEKRFRSLYVALPFTRLSEMAKTFADSGIIFGSAQALPAKEEDFTYPLAGKLVRESGGIFALVGTREERSLSNLSDASILAKLQAVHKAGLKPIYCICGKTEEELVEQLTLLKNEPLHKIETHPLLVYELPFSEFNAYLPSSEELKKFHQLISNALKTVVGKDAEKYGLIAALPADLVGFSNEVAEMPFEGGFFIKSGIHPHAVHQEAVKLFHVHCQEVEEPHPIIEEVVPVRKKRAPRKKKEETAAKPEKSVEKPVKSKKKTELP